ncbi:MAG: hypothetical protein WCD18_23630, partial [Thermosynechococcaceae cyanobacterium]
QGATPLSDINSLLRQPRLSQVVYLRFSTQAYLTVLQIMVSTLKDLMSFPLMDRVSTLETIKIFPGTMRKGNMRKQVKKELCLA